MQVGKESPQRQPNKPPMETLGFVLYNDKQTRREGERKEERQAGKQAPGPEARKMDLGPKTWSKI